VIEFSSDRKRMSTIIKTSQNKFPFSLLSKGAPEIMKNLFKKN